MFSQASPVKMAKAGQRQCPANAHRIANRAPNGKLEFAPADEGLCAALCHLEGRRSYDFHPADTFGGLAHAAEVDWS
jgi:hypothetical protein